jgi:hypothetical protein
MKNSSAARLDHQDSTNATDPPKASSSTGAVGDTVSTPVFSDPISSGPVATASLKAPDFGDLGSIYAITAKLAGRLNASKITIEEHEAYLRERQILLDKKFAGNIARKDLNRLEYVRWNLDRIEDAKYGEYLDILGMAVARYEQFGDDLSDLHQQLTQAIEIEKDKQRHRKGGNYRR